MEISEDNLQAKCVQWANNEFKTLRGFGVIHVPNGGTRNKKEAGKLKSMGVRSGVADLMIILPNGIIFFIEMKDHKGTQSDNQIEFQKFCEDRNIEYYLINNEQSFKDLINEKMMAFTL